MIAQIAILLERRRPERALHHENGDFHAVRGVSFELGTREARASSANPGSGKSTIGRALHAPDPRSRESRRESCGSATTDLLALRRTRLCTRSAAVACRMILQDPKFSLESGHAHRPSDRRGTTLRIIGSAARAARARALEMLENVHIRDPARLRRFTLMRSPAAWASAS